jgi:hypothetical protein
MFLKQYAILLYIVLSGCDQMISNLKLVGDGPILVDIFKGFSGLCESNRRNYRRNWGANQVLCCGRASCAALFFSPD